MKKRSIEIERKFAISQINLAIKDLQIARNSSNLPQWVDNWICGRLGWAIGFLDNDDIEMIVDSWHYACDALMLLDAWRGRNSVPKSDWRIEKLENYINKNKE